MTADGDFIKSTRLVYFLQHCAFGVSGRSVTMGLDTDIPKSFNIALHIKIST